MTEERTKPSWWQSAPGLMTATAAVIAAVSGLLGGLNQIGVFDRWKQPPAAETAARPSALSDSGGTSQETGAVGPVPGRSVPDRPKTAPRPRTAASPAPPKRSAAPRTSAPDTGTGPMPARDTAAARSGVGVDTAGRDTALGRSAPAETAAAAVQPDSATTAPATPPAAIDTAPAAMPTQPAIGQIPGGTALELAAANRICSTSSQPGDRVPATVVVPVTGTGGAVVPVGATAILEVTRLDAPVFLGLRADSLSLNGRNYVLRDAATKVHQREFTAGAGQTGVGIGACIPVGGRITVTLRSPVNLGRGR